MAGRPKKPTALKKLDGTIRKDRMPENEMQPNKLDLVPAPPSHFDEVAKQVWDQKAKELYELGILTTIDLDMLGRYCAAVSIATAAEKKIKSQGMVLECTNHRGNLYYQKNPHITIWKEATVEANKIASQFGFTPSSRAKISFPDKKQDDPFEALLRKS